MELNKENYNINTYYLFILWVTKSLPVDIRMLIITLTKDKYKHEVDTITNLFKRYDKQHYAIQKFYKVVDIYRYIYIEKPICFYYKQQLRYNMIKKLQELIDERNYLRFFKLNKSKCMDLLMKYIIDQGYFINNTIEDVMIRYSNSHLYIKSGYCVVVG